MAEKLYLGVDIGGTKLAVGVVGETGRQLHSARIPTLAQEASGPRETVDRLITLCRDVMKAAKLQMSDLAGVGIGCGGPLDQQAGVVLWAVNLPGWRDVPIVEWIREATQRPTALDNDANAAALGEHRFGAGRGASNMVYLTVSTGIGGGIIIDNRLYLGANGNAGELGHMSVNFHGRPCTCGSRGCVEAYASGTALAAIAREALAAGEKSSLSGLSEVTGAAVITAARHGDPLGLRVWEQALRALGMGLTNIIHAFNPQRIILGGGITGAGDFMFTPLRQYALEHAIPQLAQAVQILPAQLGDAVGIMGAAAVAMESQTH